MPITSLRFTNAGPFESIALEFDHQVNVLTGPNNSGKSTVLWVLGELLVYPFGMPSKLLRSDDADWALQLSSEQGSMGANGKLPSSPSEMENVYETLGYTCFVPAQRHGTDFRSPGPTVSQDIDLQIEQELKIVERAWPESVRKHGGEALRSQMRTWMQADSPMFKKRRKLIPSDISLVDDSAVIQKIVDLDYAAYRQKSPIMKGIIDKVATIASEITEGFPIKFAGVGEDEMGLFPRLETPDGTLPINLLSQGTQSIMQWLARLLFGYAEYYDFPQELEEKPGVLIIDEIDAHLHPSWQRRVIPTLTRYFPKLQIFCSTHSPLMLAGLSAGQVQLLKRDGNGRVTVSRNQSDIAGWTSDEILRNLLEVRSPTDVTTVGHLERLKELRRKRKLSADQQQELNELRNTVSHLLRSQKEQFDEEMKRAIDD